MKRTISILLILVLFVSLLLQVPTIAKEYPQTRYEAEIMQDTPEPDLLTTLTPRAILSSSLSILQKREIIPS